MHYRRTNLFCSTIIKFICVCVHSYLNEILKTTKKTIIYSVCIHEMKRNIKTTKKKGALS